MKKLTSLVLSAAMVAAVSVGFTACSSDALVEDMSNVVLDENGQACVKPEFVFSLPRTVVSTRMANGITQNLGTAAQFRGIDNIRLISFSEVPTETSSKLTNILRLSPIDNLSSAGLLNYKVYADQYVPVGTNNFLFYGKAIDNNAEVAIESMADKFKYGYLKAEGFTDDAVVWNPGLIMFSPVQINESVDPQAGSAAGANIVNLLTNLANALTTDQTPPDDKWSTTPMELMHNLYKNFIGLTTASTKSVSIALSRLYSSLNHIHESDRTYALAQRMKALIMEACASTPVDGMPLELKSQYQGYPSEIGLPDGAARIRWNAALNAFVDQSANYNNNMRVAIAEYVYPANLWYYTNTPLKASNEIESTEYDNAGNWESVISSVYGAAQDVVGNTTQSVALQNQVQYGVGRVETAVKMGPGPFYDGDGKEVTIGSGYTLTGVLIGGQSTVGYDFTPKGNDNRTLFDREVPAGIVANVNVTTSPNQTLALETRSNQVVNMALQLVNGGEDFMGADGIIPAGGTFYLACQLDPTTASNYVNGSLDKIVMQDHVTQLTVTINNGGTEVDRNGDGVPDVYVKDPDGTPIGVDVDGDGTPDPYDIDGDGTPDTFITDPDKGGPGWDTDGDGTVDRPVTPDTTTGNYPDTPNVPSGLGNATNGVPDLTSPGIEIGASVNLQWIQGLILNPSI